MVPIKYTGRGVKMEQPLDFVRNFLRLSYALTGQSAQGRPLGNFETEDEPERGLTVCTSHAKFDSRGPFTGTSRCRSGLLLQVA